VNNPGLGGTDRCGVTDSWLAVLRRVRVPPLSVSTLDKPVPGMPADIVRRPAEFIV